MTVKTLKKYLKGIPDDTEISVVSFSEEIDVSYILYNKYKNRLKIHID